MRSLNMIMLISRISVFQGERGEKGDKGDAVSVTLNLVLHIKLVGRNSCFMETLSRFHAPLFFREELVYQEHLAHQVKR